jgi:hypothetical protein
MLRENPSPAALYMRSMVNTTGLGSGAGFDALCIIGPAIGTESNPHGLKAGRSPARPCYVDAVMKNVLEPIGGPYFTALRRPKPGQTYQRYSPGRRR